jgi:NitT/TauT family transport system permease protein
MTARHRTVVWVLRIGLVALIVGAWIWGNSAHVSRLLLPDFTTTFRTFGTLVIGPSFWEALGRTLYEMVVSFVIAAVLGTLVGFWAARSDLRAKVIEPIAVWGYMAPLFLFYPLFILWFNVGPESKIALAAASSFFPIVYGSLRAFRSVDEVYLKVARAYGASARQTDWQIKLRASLPMLASGYRIGAAYTITTVLAAEVLASTGGLGYLLAKTSQGFDTSMAFALTIAIVLVVAGLQFLLNRLFSGGKGAQRTVTTT